MPYSYAAGRGQRTPNRPPGFSWRISTRFFPRTDTRHCFEWIPGENPTKIFEKPRKLRENRRYCSARAPRTGSFLPLGVDRRAAWRTMRPTTTTCSFRIHWWPKCTTRVAVVRVLYVIYYTRPPPSHVDNSKCWKKKTKNNRFYIIIIIIICTAYVISCASRYFIREQYNTINVLTCLQQIMMILYSK